MREHAGGFQKPMIRPSSGVAGAGRSGNGQSEAVEVADCSEPLSVASEQGVIQYFVMATDMPLSKV